MLDVSLDGTFPGYQAATSVAGVSQMPRRGLDKWEC